MTPRAVFGVTILNGHFPVDFLRRSHGYFRVLNVWIYIYELYRFDVLSAGVLKTIWVVSASFLYPIVEIIFKDLMIKLSLIVNFIFKKG